MNIGDIRYPQDNPKSRWWKRSFYDILVEQEIRDDGSIYERFQRLYSYDSAVIFSYIIKLNEQLTKEEEIIQ